MGMAENLRDQRAFGAIVGCKESLPLNLGEGSVEGKMLGGRHIYVNFVGSIVVNLSLGLSGSEILQSFDCPSHMKTFADRATIGWVRGPFGTLLRLHPGFL